jgi:NAD(P)-dependent dehydrogenase (short-subunit alcohol dehydrogenase family)
VAEHGGKIVIGDMLETEGEATAATIRAAGGGAVFVKTDVTKEGDCARLAETAVDEYGSLDALICCAGILQGAMLQAEALEPATFERVLAVNTKGTFLTVRAALPHLRKAENPVILLLASEAGTKIPSSSLAYGASKGGVHGFAMTLEAQLAPHGVRVNEICPSSIATPMRIENLVDRARAAGRDPEQARAEAIRDA